MPFSIFYSDYFTLWPTINAVLTKIMKMDNSLASVWEFVYICSE